MLLGDWAWIERAWGAGLDCLDGLKKPAPAGLLVRFWKRLAEVAAASDGDQAAATDACRGALQEAGGIVGCLDHRRAAVGRLPDAPVSGWLGV